MLTNHSNLPAAIVRAIANDPYDSGDCDISVTRLIGPPMIRHLTDKYRDEIIEDASDRIWALVGQAIHAVIERSQQPSELSEERLSMECNGWRVSGQFDLFDGATVTDMKVTSVWAIKEGVKEEWVAQLNMLAHLLRANGFQPQHLQIVAILRDWRKNERARYGDDYPRTQAVALPVPVWTPDTCKDYMSHRVSMHRAAVPAPCTPSERWDRPTVWAVMKPGRKSALRLLESERQANEWISDSGQCGLEVVKREGQSVRCIDYCPVRQWCEYGSTL